MAQVAGFCQLRMRECPTDNSCGETSAKHSGKRNILTMSCAWVSHASAAFCDRAAFDHQVSRMTQRQGKAPKSVCKSVAALNFDNEPAPPPPIGLLPDDYLAIRGLTERGV